MKNQFNLTYWSANQHISHTFCNRHNFYHNIIYVCQNPNIQNIINTSEHFRTYLSEYQEDAFYSENF